MPGCFQYVDLFYNSLLFGTTTWVLPVPDVSSLAGLQLYFQSAVWDTPANPLGITISNGAEATLGY